VKSIIWSRASKIRLVLMLKWASEVALLPLGHPMSHTVAEVFFAKGRLGK
jgi:hypothetical protein